MRIDVEDSENSIGGHFDVSSTSSSSGRHRLGSSGRQDLDLKKALTCFGLKPSDERGVILFGLVIAKPRNFVQAQNRPIRPRAKRLAPEPTRLSFLFALPSYV